MTLKHGRAPNSFSQFISKKCDKLALFQTKTDQPQMCPVLKDIGLFERVHSAMTGTQVKGHRPSIQKDGRQTMLTSHSV